MITDIPSWMASLLERILRPERQSNPDVLVNICGIDGFIFISHNILSLFYLFGSSDQTNNGSEISDPNVLICKIRKKSKLLEAVTSLYKYTYAEKLRVDHCVKIVK
jgi:hypothetical protein